MSDLVRPLGPLMCAWGAVAAVSIAGTQDLPANRFTVVMGGNSLEIPYSRNQDESANDEAITRIVFVVHGSGGSAITTRNRMRSAAVMANQRDETLIIAPQFLEESDLEQNQLGAEVLYWGGGWRHGDLSGNTTAHPRPFRVSSFEVIDLMAQAMANPSVFPNLSDVIFVDFSAGGQFVNRYAAGSQLEDTFLRPMGFDVRYVPGGASTQVYFNKARRIAGTFDQFEFPNAEDPNDPNAYCPVFNQYGMGLENLNNYMSRSGRAQIREQFSRRDITYIIGTEDTLDQDLDIRCQAMYQGRQRYERAIIYTNYVQHYFGPQVLSSYRLGIVANMGHSETGAFTSRFGMRSIFDVDPGPNLVLHVDSNAPAGGDGSRLGSRTVHITRTGAPASESTAFRSCKV